MHKGLTTFRAFAFFAVFLFHVGELRIGYLGVQAFFVLSGFLLTPILLDMKSNLGTKDFFLHFYGRRALRIFPLYYFYLTLVALLSFAAISRLEFFNDAEVNSFLAQLPWSATFTYNFIQASIYAQETKLVSHFWSLAVEEQFYLVWPLAIFIVPQKHLKTFLILAAASGLVFRCLMAYISLNQLAPMLHPKTDVLIYLLTFTQIDAFVIGGFFALYVKGRSGLSVWFFILAVIVIGLMASWITGGNIPWASFGYPHFMKDAYKYIWGYTLMSLLFAYILVCVRDRQFLPAIFENPILHYLGKVSFGMYVYHFPMIWVIGLFPIEGVSKYILILTAFTATIAVSIASYELMEKRFLNLKEKYFSRDMQPVAQGVKA